MKAYMGCDIGLKRAENQDAVTTETLGDGVLAIVCDGMGGMQNGSAASRIAIETAKDSFLREYRPGMEPAEICAILRNCAAAANHEVYQAAVHGEVPSRMGSTLVGVFARDDAACIVNVGDSRAYLIEAEGDARQLTTDHTVVQLLYEQGVIRAEERATHARRNELMRAIGVSSRVLADTQIILPAKTDRILLCSDGLYGMVDDRELAELVRGTSPAELPEKAIAAANENGGRDNISLVLLVRE